MARKTDVLGIAPAMVTSPDFSIAISGSWAPKPADYFMSACPLQLVVSSRTVIHLTLPLFVFLKPKEKTHCGLTETVGK